MIMSKQKELSDSLIKHTNQEVVVYHQKQKKLQKLNNYVLPDAFGKMLKKTGYKHPLIINASKEPSQYQLAKKLASLFWIKAVKTDKCNIYFKETKLGNIIKNKFFKYKIHNLILKISYNGIIPISITVVGFAISALMSSLIPLDIFGILAIGIETVSERIENSSKQSEESQDATPYRCIDALKSHMNPKDLKYESLLLKKYAIKRSD